MKKLAAIISIALALVLGHFLLTGCKKETVKPAAPEPGPKTYLYVYRVIGYDKLDTAAVYINGKFAYNTGAAGYHEPFMQGDTVDFYFSGKRTVIYMDTPIGEPEQASEESTNSGAERAAGIPIGLAEANFAIWRDWNNGLTVQYFYPAGNRIKARIIIY